MHFSELQKEGGESAFPFERYPSNDKNFFPNVVVITTGLEKC